MHASHVCPMGRHAPPPIMRPVQYGGSTISGHRLITKEHEAADGMLSLIHLVNTKLVKQCGVYVCHCGVRRIRGRRLHSTGGRFLKIQSSYNSIVAAEILTETAYICSFQSVYWEQSLGVCYVYTSNWNLSSIQCLQ